MRLLEDPASLGPLQGCALVPTMGALHAGHLALCRRAAESGRDVVVSIFVNPTQFGPHEDFSRYPRSLEGDLHALASLPTPPAAVFAPSADAIYPEGLERARDVAGTLPLPACATLPQLEDRCRPGHLAGVALVVGRLFDQARPSVAVFGEKDYQQLRLVEEMVAADPVRFGPLRIVRGETVREPDGLAMSSRNRFLAGGDRARALGLSAALHRAQAERDPSAAGVAMAQVLAAHGLETEYAVVRDDRTLGRLPVDARHGRALVAARLGSVRLIDNLPWHAAAPLD